MKKVDKIKDCPFCGKQPEVNICDRLISIKCNPCGYSRGFESLLQTKPDTDNEAGGLKPIPKMGKDNIIDYTGGEFKEYYHIDAEYKAIKKWNNRA